MKNEIDHMYCIPYEAADTLYCNKFKLETRLTCDLKNLLAVAVSKPHKHNTNYMPVYSQICG